MNWGFILGTVVGIVALIIYDANKKLAAPKADVALTQKESDLDEKINSAQQQADNVRPIIRDPKTEENYYNNPNKGDKT